MNSGMARRLGVELFIVSVVGAALGLIGPFGTFAMPGGARMAYWILFILAGYACFRPMIGLGEHMSVMLNLPGWVGRTLAILIAALPTTLLVALMFAGFDWRAALTREATGVLYGQVCLIGVIVNGLFMLLFPKTAEPVAAPVAPSPAVVPAEPPAPEPPAAARLPAAPPPGPALLPPGFGPVIALGSEDHYVRVMAADRDTLILIRLRDAIAALGCDDGLQVHRSWWVARAGLAKVHRKGREAEIELVTGLRLPVARTALPALREAGWLKR